MLRSCMIALLLGSGVAHANGRLATGPPRPGVQLPVERDRPPLEVTPEMSAWLHANVSTAGTTGERLRRLLRALDTLDIAYVGVRTVSASQVFEIRQANCLSYTHLVIALARELGVDAYYLRVDDTRTWRAGEALVVVSGHVTPGYGPVALGKRVELGVGPVGDGLQRERISDAGALALHHNNLGAQELLAGDLDGAVRELQTASALDPELPEVWVNLGVARYRGGQLPEAEEAYRQAIALDPDRLSAWTDLAAVYQRLGDAEATRALLHRADRRRNRNPQTFAALAQLATAAGEPELARRYTRRAQRLDRG